MIFKRVLCIFMSFMPILLTGCWDKVEIDDRAFVLAMVITTADNDKLNAAFYMPIPSKLKAAETFSVEEAQGENLPMAVENLNMKFSRQMFFGETKVILVAEEALADDKFLKRLIDFVEREPDMGREAQIAVIKGDVKNLASVKPKFENVFASYLLGILNNSAHISSELSLSINEFLNLIRENKGSVVMPVVEIEGDKVSVKQLALIKDYKLLSYMDTKYLKPYSMITDTLKDGNILVPYKNDTISLKVASANRKISLVTNGDNLEFKIGIKIEGDIDNYICNEGIFDDKSINSIKDKIGEYVKNELDKTTVYCQKDLGYDYLGLREYTKKYENKVYKKYENTWDEAFKKAKIEYDVQIFIRRLGGTRQ